MDWPNLDPPTRVWIQPDSNADVSHIIIIPKWVMSWLPERDLPILFKDNKGVPVLMTNLVSKLTF